MKILAEALAHSNCKFCGSPAAGSKYCCLGCETLDGNFQYKVPIPELSYLDQPNFKMLYKLNLGSFDYQLYVEGLHCSACVHLIEKLPYYDSEVEIARVDFSQSKLYLKVKNGFSLTKCMTTLSALGYAGQFLKASQEIKGIQERENKTALKKLAVAGACAGNIMLFVIPVYSGLLGPWKLAFNWMSFLLFLPIIFYSSTSFYKGAWSSLKMRMISIDLPITVAMLTGFFLSTINLIRGNDAIYFDSTASFIFLILSSRYLLKKIQQKYLTSLELEDIMVSDSFLRIDGLTETKIPLSEVNSGDLIKLVQGQIVPVDGHIENKSALVDVSVLNGEPMPRKFEMGMEIQAGSKIISPIVYLRAKNRASNSHLANTLKQLNEGLWSKSKFITLTDRTAHILILTVFAVAILFFIFYFNHDPQEAFNRSLALLVLACPCALALGSPLAIALAVKKAQEKGILVKNADVFEKLLSLKNIFFDKTGTLTETDLQLVSSKPKFLTDKTKSIILGLETHSYHPIAFALRKIWSKSEPAVLTGCCETAGFGVSGVLGTENYELATAVNQTESYGLEIDLKRNGQTIATLNFENSLREESAHCIQTLQKSGLNCFIVSGDSKSRVDRIAFITGIPLVQSFGNLSSNKKSEIVQSFKNTCMIGDGTNDSPSLAVADIGIAVKGSTYINLHAADVCFTRGGLTSLIDLFELSKKAKHVLTRNLGFSLIYNLTGAVLALSGYVSPWLAAILMPISSVLIIFSTLWGLR